MYLEGDQETLLSSPDPKMGEGAARWWADEDDPVEGEAGHAGQGRLEGTRSLGIERGRDPGARGRTACVLTARRGFLQLSPKGKGSVRAGVAKEDA